jgi:hypothetical protein
MRKLLGTLGDAEAFVTRPEMAAAMEKRFHAEYSWLSQRADAIVVVAHSQGAALTYRALRALDERDRVALIGVFCMGSGLGPLSSIASPSRSWLLSTVTLICALPGFVTLPTALIPVAVVATVSAWTVILVLATLSLLAWGVIFFPGDVWSSLRGLAEALANRIHGDFSRSAPLVGLALGLALPSLVVTFFAGAGRRRRLTPLLSVDRWIEYFSPLDPVSLGTRGGNHATIVRVVNLHGLNIFTEHSAYFTNDRGVLPDLCQRLGHWLSVKLPSEADAAPDLPRRRVITRLVLAAPSMVTMLIYLAGRPWGLW